MFNFIRRQCRRPLIGVQISTLALFSASMSGLYEHRLSQELVMDTEALLTQAHAGATAPRKPSQAETNIAGLIRMFQPCCSSYRGVVQFK